MFLQWCRNLHGIFLGQYLCLEMSPEFGSIFMNILWNFHEAHSCGICILWFWSLTNCIQQSNLHTWRIQNKNSLSAVVKLTNLLLPYMYVKHTDSFMNLYPELSEPERYTH